MPSRRDAWQRAGLAAVASLAPFVFYYRYIVANRPSSLTITNDFLHLSYRYKVFLLDTLASGNVRFWSPGEGAGFPLFSSPFVQFFYPLNLPLALYYRVAGGYSVVDHQTFTVLGIAVFSLGLFLWLETLVPSRRSVLFATVLVGLSWKLGEILRFPNAVHTAAWIPWILYAVTAITGDPKHKKGRITLFVSCVMLLTAGYPYYVYYCLFLVVPWVLLLLATRTRRVLMSGEHVLDIRRLLVTLVIAPAAALALCAPYLRKMSELLEETTDRGGGNYAYSTAYEFTFSDTVGSLVFPPAAQAEGWYYFSILGVLLIAAFAVGVVREQDKRDQRLLVIAAVWFGLLSYITYQDESVLFEFLWHYLPGFSKLRVWGRMGIILLPIIALVLARGHQYCETLRGRRAVVVALGVIVTAVLINGVQRWLLSEQLFDPYWNNGFAHLHGRESQFLRFTWIAALSLATPLLMMARRPAASARVLTGVTAVWLLVGLSDIRAGGGSEQWARDAAEVEGEEIRMVRDYEEVFAASFSEPRVQKRTALTYPSLNVGVVPNWYFERYTTFLKKHRRNGNFGRFMGIKDGQRIYVTQALDRGASLERFLADADRARGTAKATVKAYDGDVLDLAVSAQKPVYVSFIDNWNEDWRVLVDGRDAKMERPFGTFKGVRVEAGEHRVRFEYVPFF